MYCQPTVQRTTLPRWGSPPAPREPVPGQALNCFTYCLLVYNLPLPPHTPGSTRLGLLEVCNRAIGPKKQLRQFLSNSFPQALPWQGEGEIQTGGLKGRLARQLRRRGSTAAGGGRGRMQTLFSTTRLFALHCSALQCSALQCLALQQDTLCSTC